MQIKAVTLSSHLRLEDLPSKLKGMVRNAKKAEAEITALKISYLKKIGKGSNVIIMDSSVHPNRLPSDCFCLPASFNERGRW